MTEKMNGTNAKKNGKERRKKRVFGRINSYVSPLLEIWDQKKIHEKVTARYWYSYEKGVNTLMTRAIRYDYFLHKKAG